MTDFGILPPEINSALMYAGAGASPLIEAATSWTSIAGELSAAAASFGATIGSTAATWTGPSSLAMQLSAFNYQTWLSTAAAQAAATSAQAMAAVAAYESAFLATVPPMIVAANRTLLGALVATNFLGINTPAIMATEAHYVEMWAQDVAAMFGYSAGSQAAAAALPVMTPPTALPSIGSLVSGIVSGLQSSPLATWLQNFLNLPLVNLANTYLQNFISSGPWQIPLEVLGLFSNLWGANSIASDINHDAGATPTPAGAPVSGCCPGGSSALGALGRSPMGSAGANASAALGSSPRIGRLSVPPSWTKMTARAPSAESPHSFSPLTTSSEGSSGVRPIPFGMPMGMAGMGAGGSGSARQLPNYGRIVRFVTRPPSGG